MEEILKEALNVFECIVDSNGRVEYSAVYQARIEAMLPTLRRLLAEPLTS